METRGSTRQTEDKCQEGYLFLGPGVEKEEAEAR
jgi:hypothetical protein